MIHGPGNKGNLNLLVNFVNKGIPYPFAAFQNKRSFLSIFNLVFLIGKITESNIESGIYNVSDNLAISTNELIEIIGESYNKKIRMLKIPAKLVRIIFNCLDFLSFKIGTEQLDKIVENYQVSNAKILNALDVKLPISTKEGLKITIHSFQKK
jgi:nucleoside-diphosphate-sugar epimerase